MSEIGIKGIGVVGGFGCGKQDLIRRLQAGYAEPKEVSVETAKDEVQLPVLAADTSRVTDYVPKRSLRRLDRYSRLAVLAAYMAMEDGGITDWKRERIGLVVATGYGATRTTFNFLDTVIDDGDQLASPVHFSASVHNAAAAHIGILTGIRGPSLTVSQFELSFPSAMLTALQWIKGGRVDSILIGGVDEYCDVLGYCRSVCEQSRRKNDPLPGAIDRLSPIIGEGAAFFYLTKRNGIKSGYAVIRDTNMGKGPIHARVDPSKTVFFLGAEDLEGVHRGYTDLMRSGAHLASYSSLYGSLPIGTAFDLAIAAVSVQQGLLYPSATQSLPYPVLAQSRQGQSLEDRDICCIQSNHKGYFGLIRLERDG